MKELSKYFKGRGEVKGYIFKQIVRSHKAYIYEISSEDSSRKHYEVFKKVENRRYNCISYPTSKAFGIWAWTCMSLERAVVKFNELNAL